MLCACSHRPQCPPLASPSGTARRGRRTSGTKPVGRCRLAPRRSALSLLCKKWGQHEASDYASSARTQAPDADGAGDVSCHATHDQDRLRGRRYRKLRQFVARRSRQADLSVQQRRTPAPRLHAEAVRRRQENIDDRLRGSRCGAGNSMGHRCCRRRHARHRRPARLGCRAGQLRLVSPDRRRDRAAGDRPAPRGIRGGHARDQPCGGCRQQRAAVVGHQGAARSEMGASAT